MYGFVYSGLDLGAMLGPVWFGLMLDNGHSAPDVLRRQRPAGRRGRHRSAGTPQQRPRANYLGVIHGSWNCRPPRACLRGQQGVGSRLRRSAGARRRRRDDCGAHRSDGARTAEEIGAMAGRKVAWVACDITTRGGPCRGAGRVSAAGHPGQQRRRTAARRFPRLGSRCVAARHRCQHAHADRTHQGHRRRHDRAQVRPHREHHVGRSEGADRCPRAFQRRAQRA